MRNLNRLAIDPVENKPKAAIFFAGGKEEYLSDGHYWTLMAILIAVGFLIAYVADFN